MNAPIETAWSAPGPSSSPLRGIRVVDFGQWMAGPAAAMLLCDNGAEVIHVDPPEGPRWTGGAEVNLNRGKRRVRLDLRDGKDLDEVKRLIRSADVVIENFAPGTMAEFGLDYASLAPLHPELVYLSLPGFASTDLEYPNVSGYEGVIATASGQFADMGVNRRLMGIEASYSPLPLGSTYAAIFGALGVTLALRARLRHGMGENVEVPIASSLLEGLSYNAMEVDDLPLRYLSRREREIARRRDVDQPMGVTYDDLQELLDPFYRSYPCADGRPFYVVALSHRAHPRHVLEVLGIYDEAIAAGLPTFDPYLSSADWPDGADCTLYAHPITDHWAGWLSSRIAAALATKPSDEWEQIFAERGIPAAAHRTSKEWLATEHPLAAGLLVDVDHPDLGRTRRMGPVAWLEERQDGPARTASDPHPRSASTDAAPSGWLDGVTVVDLTNVIAGPTIAGTLARFGARVIKVDPPTPTFDPWNTVLCGYHSNRGKESVLLNVRTPQGKSALLRLLGSADVVTVNATSRQLESLGLSPRDLADIAPHVILCQLDAWSGPESGPWSNRLGYDDLVQAATGIASRFGGGNATPEEHAHFGTIDVLGGLGGALSTALALYVRDATGRICTARTSLAAAGQLLQAPFLFDHAQRPAWDEPSGPEARGEGPTYGLYRASDTWMFVAIPDRDAKTHIASILGRDAAGVPDPTVALTEAFRARTAADWADHLVSQGISIQPLTTLSHLRAMHTDSSPAPWTSSSYHFTRVADHPSGHSVTLVAPLAIRPARAPIVVPHDAPKYGAHTDAILAEFGYSTTEIDDLMVSGDAGRAWSATYLPS